jgi:ATP-dependent protease HslVU (ClpYQ) peptidase subunit
MTTVATDGKSMAADGQSSTDDGPITNLNRRKITKLPGGSIVGGAGQLPDILRLTAWLEDGGQQKPPRIREPLAMLQLMPTGEVLYWNEELEPHPIDVPAAVGSGAELALGAMLAGASPKEAVGIACQRDPMSGGKITVLSL